MAKQGGLLTKEQAAGKGAVRTATAVKKDPYRIMLVSSVTFDIYYQLFVSPKELRFYRVGNALTKANQKRLQRADAQPRKLGERDFRIAARDVEHLLFAAVEGRRGVIQLRMCVRANGRSRCFDLLEFDPVSERAFLDALRDFAPDRREDPDGLFEIGPRRAQYDLVRAKWLKVAIAALAALALAVQPAWLLADVPYRPFAVLSLLPFPMLFALCLIFPNELSLRGTKLLADGRARVTTLLIVTSFVPFGRAIVDFKFLDWRPLVLLSALLAIVLLLAFMLRKREWRSLYTLFLVPALALMFYVPGLVAYLNYLPDTAAPDVRPALVTSIRVEDDDGTDIYALELTVIDGDEKLRIHVPPERYDQVSSGDEIRLLVHPGWLGIPYYDVKFEP